MLKSVFKLHSNRFDSVNRILNKEVKFPKVKVISTEPENEFFSQETNGIRNYRSETLKLALLSNVSFVCLLFFL